MPQTPSKSSDSSENSVPADTDLSVPTLGDTQVIPRPSFRDTINTPHPPSFSQQVDVPVTSGTPEDESEIELDSADVELIHEELQAEVKDVKSLSSYDVVYGLFSFQEIDDDLASQLQQLVSHIELVQEQPPVWGVAIHGERPVARMAAIFDLFKKAAKARGFSEPSLFARGSTLSVDQNRDANHLPNIFRDMAANLTDASMAGKVVVDHEFLRIYKQPRNRGYVQLKLTSMVENGIAFLSDLSPSASLMPGGAKKQYLRDAEEFKSLSILRGSLRSGGCRFMTLEAGAQMGKSRMVSELVKKLTAEFPDLRVVFVPAMDYRKNGAMTYLHSFLEVLLSTTKDVAPLSGSPEFYRLATYLSDPKSLQEDKLMADLSQYLNRVQGSGVRLLFALDDAQWIDNESAIFLSRIIEHPSRLKNTLGIFAARRGDETISNVLLHKSGVKKDDRIFLKNLALVDSRGLPVPELKEFVCDLLGFNLSREGADHIQIADDVLIQIAKLSEGNPGRLTGTVMSMKESGVLRADLQRKIVTTDVARLATWESAGDADSALVNEIERLISKPDARTVLTYVIAITEMGTCSWALMQRFIDVFLKRPELNTTLSDLDTQGIVARSGGSEDAVFIPRDRFVECFKKLVPENEFKRAYRFIARSMHGLRTQAQGRPIIPQASAYNIYISAAKAGSIDYQDMYCFEAFDEAYAVKNYRVMLSIYSYVLTRPELAAKLKGNVEFMLRNLEAIRATGGAWLGSKGKPGHYEELGDEYRDLIRKDMFMSPPDWRNFERLCTLMIEASYSKAFSVDTQAGLELMKKWSAYYSDTLLKSFSGSPSFNNNERLIVAARTKFYDALMAYVVQAKIKDPQEQKVCIQQCGFGEMCLDIFVDQIDANPEYLAVKNDLRFKRIYVEAKRILANSMMNTFNLLEMGEDLTPGSFDDVMLCNRIALWEPNSSLFMLMKDAYTYFLKYLLETQQDPDALSTRATLYKATQAAGRCAAVIGQYTESWGHLKQARSLALKAGDATLFGETTLDTAMMIQLLTDNLQHPDAAQREDLWNEALELLTVLELEYGTTGNRIATEPDDILRRLQEFGRVFVKQSIPVLRDRSPFYHGLAVLAQLENAVASFEYALSRGDSELPNIHHLMEGLLQLFPKFPEMFRGAEKEFWDFYGFPLYARFGLCLDAAAKRDPTLAPQRDMFFDQMTNEYLTEQKKMLISVKDPKSDKFVSRVRTGPVEKFVDRRPVFTQSLNNALIANVGERIKGTRGELPEYVASLEKNWRMLSDFITALHPQSERELIEKRRG